MRALMVEWLCPYGLTIAKSAPKVLALMTDSSFFLMAENLYFLILSSSQGGRVEAPCGQQENAA